VSFPAASSAVARLVDLGILAERTGYRRNRLFAATEALLIVDRPFGADPVLPSLLTASCRSARAEDRAPAVGRREPKASPDGPRTGPAQR